jgi:hypothetical protein
VCDFTQYDILKRRAPRQYCEKLEFGFLETKNILDIYLKSLPSLSHLWLPIQKHVGMATKYVEFDGAPVFPINLNMLSGSERGRQFMQLGHKHAL